MDHFYPGTNFEIGNVKYWYMQMFDASSKPESILMEDKGNYRYETFGYPYKNSHPGLGKVKAWIKKNCNS